MISVLTKYFSPEWYGEYNKIYNYLGIFAFLADLWLYTLTIREISKDQSKAEKIIGNMMSLRLILWIFVMIFAFWLAFLLPWYSSHATLFWIIIVAFFTIFNLLNSSVMSLMQAFMKIEFSMISTIVSRSIQIVLMILVLFLAFPQSNITDFQAPFLWILVCGTLWALIQYVMNLYYARKIAKISFLWDLDFMKKMFFQSLPYGIALFLSVVYFKIDIIFLSFLLPQEIANYSIAMYSLPMKIIEVLMVLWVFYLNAVLPHLSEYFHNFNAQKIQEILNKSMIFLGSFGMFVLVMWFLFQEHLLQIIATEEYINNSLWYSSLDVFGVVLGVLVFYFFSSLGNYICIASKNEKKLLYINGIITLVNIIGNIIFIPKYGFMGAAYVTLFSQILLSIILYVVVKKIIDFSFDFISLWKIFLFGMIFFFLAQKIIEIFPLWVWWEFFLYGIIFSGIFSAWIFLMFRKMFKKITT